MTQVHKETLGAIENALPNRSNLDVEIFGMEGIPQDVVDAHNTRVISSFAQAEAERRAATGNLAPGNAGHATKKPKLEAPSDLKKRLAEHKAKKAAEQAAGIGSGDATPIDAVGSQSPGFGQPPGFVSPVLESFDIPMLTILQSGPAPFAQSYGAPPSTATYGAYPQPYGQSNTPFQAPQSSASPPAPQFGQQVFTPPQQQYPPVSNAYAPPSQYQAGPTQPPFQNITPRPFGTNSPPVPFRVQTPPQGLPQPQRQNSLPAAPGLPQRPSFGAPPVNAFQMQQMHQGQMQGPPTTTFNNQQAESKVGFDGNQNGIHGQTTSSNIINPSQDKLSSLAAPHENGTGSSLVPSAETKAEAKSEDAPVEKKSKKDKEKETRMVYTDNETSPEEKMARLSRYAFNPRGREETVMGDATTATVTGVVSISSDATTAAG